MSMWLLQGQTYLVPRSIARKRPPVCRVRWKPMSIWRRWANVFLATWRMALWDTLANTAFRSSENKVEKILASASMRYGELLASYAVSKRTGEKDHLQPVIAVPPMTHTVVSAVISTFRASTISLKKNGTCTFSI